MELGIGINKKTKLTPQETKKEELLAYKKYLLHQTDYIEKKTNSNRKWSQYQWGLILGEFVINEMIYNNLSNLKD